MISWYRFNPGHETSLLSGDKNYTPTKAVQKMMTDLELLPLHYAEEKGFVLSCKTLKDFPIKIKTQSIKPKDFSIFLSNKKYRIEPWGKAPDIIEWYRKQINTYNLPKIDIHCPLNQKKLTSRQTGTILLKRLINKQIGLFEQEIVPKHFTNIDELLENIASTTGPKLLKAPFSSSGRGLLIIDKKILNEHEKKRIQGILNKQGSISSEPLQNKIADFALEFYSDGEGHVFFTDYSFFKTDFTGRYNGNLLAHQSRLKEILLEFAPESLWEMLKKSLCEALGELFGQHYSGPLGIDMITYKKGGKVKIHPCIEINLRWTMGLVAAKLYHRYVHPKSEGIYAVRFFKKNGEALAYTSELSKKYPPIIKHNRIVEGFLSLCPVDSSTSYIATMEINKKNNVKDNLFEKPTYK